MSPTDRRTKAFEEKFTYDAEKRFKHHVRVTRAMGRWAAQIRELDVAESEAYAKTLVEDMLEKGFEPTLKMIREELLEGGFTKSGDFTTALERAEKEATARAKAAGQS